MGTLGGRDNAAVTLEEIVGSAEKASGWTAEAKPVLRKVVAREVVPRLASSIMEFLSRTLPLCDMALGHLKRIRRDSERLLVLVGDRDSYDRAMQRGNLFELPDSAEFEVEVPVAAARTREQYERGNQHWPMTRAVATDRSPTRERISKLVSNHAASALESVHSPNGLPLCATAGAVLVSPDGKPTASAADERSANLHNLHPLDHAPMLCIEANARRHRQSRKRRDVDDEYLCTGFDLVTSHEPCVMCAMALVHARIRSVAFAHPDPIHGGLGSTVAVHTLRSINHRYRAFRFRNSAVFDAPKCSSDISRAEDSSVAPRRHVGD